MGSNDSQLSEKKLILIAEDYPQNMLQAVSVTRRLGYQVEEAGNGREAYQKSVERHPFLVLMDILMPTMDGLTSIKVLKANPETRDIPIIVLTSLGADGDCEKCLQAGADGYLKKPIKEGELRAKISEITGREDPKRDV